MKPYRIRLTLVLMLSCIGIALLPVFIYSILSISLFSKGLDTINRSVLIKAIHEYADSETNNKNLNNKTKKIYITTDYNEIPSNLRDKLPSRIKNDTLYRIDIHVDDDNYENLYCLISVNINNKTFYAYQKFSSIDAELFIKPQGRQTIYILLVTAAIILIVLLVFCRYLIKKISEPTRKLADWATNLNSTNVKAPLPDLVYPELYNLAELIQNNLSNGYAQIQREELFWRYCGHELRTPISVICVGIELLQKKIDNSIFNYQQYSNILGRLKRSSHSMSNLIETILWIGNSDKQLTRHEVDISCIINEIIQDFYKIYLIDSANLNISISSYTMQLPPQAVRIVLENLIRNAFQHSMGDEICIVQNKNVIKIINKLLPENGLVENTGFGLGLDLIERLSNRLGWVIKILKDKKYNIVIVTFN